MSRLDGRAAVWLRRAAVALILVAAAVALARQWDRVQAEAAELSPAAIVAAGLSVWIGIGASMLAWRAVLADLGTRLPLGDGMRMFFLAQLGKYVPGSVWPLVTHMELGRRHGIRRHRSATALAVTMALSILSGILVAAAALPLAGSDEADAYLILLLAVPMLAVFLHPRILSGLLDRGLRLARREPLERPPTWRGIAEGTAWLCAMWLLFGLQAWVLARDLGGTGAALLPLAIGAFAVSWTSGFLVLITPAGLGVREAGLVAFLAGSIGTPAATVLAVCSRLLLTVADLAWAAAAAAARPAARPRRTRPPPARG